MGYYTNNVIIDDTTGYVVTYRTDSTIYTQFDDRFKLEVQVFSKKEEFFKSNNITVPVADLYCNLASTLLHLNIKELFEKYRYITKHTQIKNLRSKISLYIIKILLFKSTGSSHWGLLK